MADPYAVPAEMRDFADRSVQQARKAFEGFMGAVKKSSGALEQATSSSPLNVAGASSKAVTLAEKNVTAAFDLAQKLVHAKDIQEVMAIQSEYMKTQMAAIQEQTRELGEAFTKSMTPGGKK
jgi:phasin